MEPESDNVMLLELLVSMTHMDPRHKDLLRASAQEIRSLRAQNCRLISEVESLLAQRSSASKHVGPVESSE